MYESLQASVFNDFHKCTTYTGGKESLFSPLNSLFVETVGILLGYLGLIGGSFTCIREIFAQKKGVRKKIMKKIIW